MQAEVKEMIKDISKEFNVPEDIVKAVIDSQYQFTKLMMGQGNPEDASSFINVRHIHLGIFVVKPYKIAAINNANKLKQNGRNCEGNKDI